eukprot:jgi/Tetstr1/461760/TSEL_006849.t1
MFGDGSPTGLKMAGAGKPAPATDVATTATPQDSIEAARRDSDDKTMKQLIEEQLSMFFTTQETTTCRRLPPVKRTPFPAGTRTGTSVHRGDSFALDVVRERDLRPGTGNLGSLKFT